VIRGLTRHKIISRGQDHHGGSDQDKNSWLFEPDIGSVSTDVPRCPTFLKNKDSALRRVSVDNPNGGQNGGQTHSQTKRRVRWSRASDVCKTLKP
jgi:hypothetical protein